MNQVKERLEEAKREQARVEAAFNDAEQALAKMTEDLESAEPDDDKGIASLIQKQNLARGRAVSLGGKLARARASVESAAKDLTAAIDGEAAKRAQELADDFQREDAELVQAARDLGLKLEAGRKRLEQIGSQYARGTHRPAGNRLHSVFFEYGTPLEIAARNRLG